MQGKYITQSGEVVTIHEFDEANKMVCVKTETGNNWYDEKTYLSWVSANDDIDELPFIDYPEQPETISEKPKKVRKKKTE